MEHSHSDKNDMNIGLAFKTGIALNLIFIIFEVTFGLLSNSMALVADAGHNLSDVLALAFSWIAIVLSRKSPTIKFTYGFRRSTILAALLNTLLLLVAVIFIGKEAFSRFGDHEDVNAVNVIITASVGIVINGITAWLFVRGKKHDLNVRSAFLHFVADALVSLGVVISGVVMFFTGITWLDPVVSLIILVVILFGTYRLLVDSINLSLDAVPENIDISEVKAFLENLPEADGVHDLHIWALGTDTAALTVHISTSVPTGVDFIVNIQKKLHSQFGIEHATIQVEYGEKPGGCDANCN